MQPHRSWLLRLGALQLAKQGVLAQDSSQQRLNTNLNVVVEAARFCSACVHSDCATGEPGPSHSLDSMLPWPETYCSNSNDINININIAIIVIKNNDNNNDNIKEVLLYCSTHCHQCPTYIGHENVSEVACPMSRAL